MWMRLTRTAVTPLRKQPKRLSHADIETTIFRVGIQSVNPSINFSAVSSGRRLKFGCYSSACQALQKAQGLMVQGIRSIDFSHFS